MGGVLVVWLEGVVADVVGVTVPNWVAGVVVGVGCVLVARGVVGAGLGAVRGSEGVVG